MNKKGFTLIELLAVIIILAVLSLIVAPIIGNVIESARIASDLRSAEAYIKAGENYFAAATIDPTKASKLGKVNVLDELEVSNKKATGKLYVEEDGSISMALLIRGKCYTKLASQSIKDITVTDGDNCGELPGLAFQEARIPNSGTYARESTVAISVPSGMSLYVKLNKSKEINSGTVSEKCNEDLSSCDSTSDTTLEANTWYKVGSNDIRIRTEEELILSTKQVNGRENKEEEYKIENIDSVPPTKPIISGGSATVVNSSVTISIDTLSTALSEIKQYQYCKTGENNTDNCTWNKMDSTSIPFDEEGLYYIYVKAVSNAGRETISDSQTVNIKYSPWTLIKGTGIGGVSNTSSSPEIGDIITIDTERFYVYGFENNGAKVKALAEYNLEVGNSTNSKYPPTTETNKQSSSALGWKSSGTPYATVIFSSTTYWTSGSNLKSSYGSSYPAWVYDNNSIPKSYVDTYKVILEGYGSSIVEARLLKKEEMEDLYNYYSSTTGQTLSDDSVISSWAPSWLLNTSFWTGSANNINYIWHVYSNGNFGRGNYYGNNDIFGVRPVIVINTSDL